MSNFQLTGAGNPIPSLQLVATDNETIFGDGSGQNPLRTSGGAGLVPIVGEHSEPLSRNGAPVAPRSDGGYVVVQAGTPGGPSVAGLLVELGGDAFYQYAGLLTLTLTQWDTITGGSGGLTIGAAYYVGAGDGAGALTTLPVGSQVGFAISATQLQVVLGSPPLTLGLQNNSAALGEAVVIDHPASVNVFTPAPNPGATAGRVDGIVAYINSASAVAALSGEVVTLTTGQWDAVAGTSGGLAVNDVYYLSATSGHITSTKPVATGTYATQVGIALSATQLQVLIGTPIGPHA